MKPGAVRQSWVHALVHAYRYTIIGARAGVWGARSWCVSMGGARAGVCGGTRVRDRAVGEVV